MRRKIRLGFTLVELLVVIAIIGILVALLLPAVQAAREASRRSQCTSQLKQFALAAMNYHDQIGAYPSGRSETRQFGVSWAFKLLPQLEETAVHDSFVEGERVDSDANAVAMRTPVTVFNCPSRRAPTADRDFDNDDDISVVRKAGASGDYAANAGRRLLVGLAETSDDSRPFDYRLDPAEAGPIFTYSKVAARRVVDGLSHTLAIGERHIPMAPEGTSEDKLDYWSGDTAFFAADNPTTVLGVPSHGLRTEGVRVDDGDVSRECFGGPHPGVTLFAYLDGHVDPVNNDTSKETLAKLASIADGEVIADE